ncbi:MAG: ribonuclease D [Anaerolineales bacterium]|nr:ribonuclease D [Anaerolineales bacterium]
MPPKLNDPILVSEPDQLQGLVEKLHHEAAVAVDTESNSLFAYQEQVCLIQFSTPGDDYLVDPLALPDISSLGEIFKSEQIEKVFHAAEYDLICLKRDYGFQFANIFDTMIAARTLGRGKVGLGAILKTEFDVELNKRYQRANWGQRPLPPEQLAYARLDTHYLLPLRRILKDELVQTGRWELVQEDFERLCKVEPRPARGVSESLWRINGARDLDPQHVAVLQELCRFRDKIARQKNWPVFKIMGNKVLFAIAEAAPRSRQALEKVDGAKWAARRYGDGIVKAVRQGLQADPPARPRYTRPSSDYLNRLDALRNWRKREGGRLGVDSDVILPKDLMSSIARQNPQTRQELERIMADAPERQERYGDGILNAINRGVD